MGTSFFFLKEVSDKFVPSYLHIQIVCCINFQTYMFFQNKFFVDKMMTWIQDEMIKNELFQIIFLFDQ